MQTVTIRMGWEGQTRTIVERGQVQFVFGSDLGLIWVSCDHYSFEIGPGDELKKARGWPSSQWTRQSEPYAEDPEESELWLMALEICREALQEYRQSTNYEFDLSRHQFHHQKQSYNVNAIGPYGLQETYTN